SLFNTTLTVSPSTMPLSYKTTVRLSDLKSIVRITSVLRNETSAAAGIIFGITFSRFRATAGAGFSDTADTGLSVIVALGFENVRVFDNFKLSSLLISLV